MTNAVNLSFIGGAGWQFLDDAGKILSGGKIYTYAAGTTTPLDTYTDRTGVTANSNPIVLDAYGRTPYQIWSTEGLLYKYVVKSSKDVQIRSWDNIGGSVVASDLEQRLTAPTGAGIIGFGTGHTVADLSTSAGSSLVGFLQAGTGAVPRTAQDKMRESVSVLDFGAVGDGVTDDTAAIKKAIIYACSVSTAASIYIPSGIYIVSDKVLNPPNLQLGIRFHGDGYYASILRFGTLTASSYMFNNESTNLLAFPVFENLGFEGTDKVSYDAGIIPANAGFIRQWSTGPNQGFKFINCMFAGFDRLMLCEGINTASENHWINCKIYAIQNYVLGLNNLQALNHEFVSTDIEVIYGDVFYIFGAGGGDIKVIGGSIVLMGTASTPKALISLTTNTSNIILYSPRVELRGNSKLVVSSGVVGGRLLFNGGSTFNTNGSGTKEIVTIGAYVLLKFSNFNFLTNGEVATFRITTTANYGENGHIVFDSCGVPDALASNIYYTSEYGHVTATKCLGSSYGATSGAYDLKVLDFDLGASGSWATAGGIDSNFDIKRVWMKQANFMWPRVDGGASSINESTILLPPKAIIKKIVIHYPGTGGSSATLTLQVTNGDKTVVYATTNTAAQNTLHTVAADNIHAITDTTTNNRTVRVSAAAGSLAGNIVTAGFGYIEYI